MWTAISHGAPFEVSLCYSFYNFVHNTQIFCIAVNFLTTRDTHAPGLPWLWFWLWVWLWRCAKIYLRLLRSSLRRDHKICWHCNVEKYTGAVFVYFCIWMYLCVSVCVCIIVEELFMDSSIMLILRYTLTAEMLLRLMYLQSKFCCL